MSLDPKLERLDPEYGLDGIHLDGGELSPLVRRNEGLVTMSKAGEMLNLAFKTARAVLSDETTDCLIPCVLVPARKKAGNLRLFSAQAIRTFQETFATLGNLSSEFQMHPAKVEERLTSLGVTPALDRAACGTLIFKRDAIPWEKLSA